MNSELEYRITEAQLAHASRGRKFVISMQPTVRGEAGEPITTIISEVVCPETKETDFFAGLREFVRAEPPREKLATDIALEKLLDNLRRKAGRLGADAVLSTRFNLLRATQSAGQKLIKMTAMGTAVVLPVRQN